MFGGSHPWVRLPTDQNNFVAKLSQCLRESIAPCWSKSRRYDVRFKNYLSLDDWPVRQASNAASACSRSSALLSRRGGCLFAGVVTMGVPPLTSSTPCLRIRRRCFIADQFVRAITHLLSNTRVTQQSLRAACKPAALPYRPRREHAKGQLVGAVEPGNK